MSEWTEATAIEELEQHGIKYRGGVIVVTYQDVSARTMSAIRYLCNEWDYACGESPTEMETARLARKFAVDPSIITDLQLRLQNESKEER